MSELSPLPDTPLGLYRHYKGGEYEVLGVVRVNASANDYAAVLRRGARFFG